MRRADYLNRYGCRAAWGRNGPKAFPPACSGLARGIIKRRVFSAMREKRRDTEWNTSHALWHRALHFGGITPRFTVFITATTVTTLFYEYGQTAHFYRIQQNILMP